MYGEEMRIPFYGLISGEAGEHFLFDVYKGSW